MSQPHPSTRPIWLLLAACFTWTLIRTAWVCEDAFITLRTVDFTLQGYGLVWNVGERVQAYTHPLWFFALLPTIAIIGDPYFALVTLSLACSVGVLLVVKATQADWPLHSIVGIASLLWSRAFVDYSTSGLENPLTHLLLATFIWIWLRDASPRKGLWLTLIGSALYLNRPDAVLLVLPALTWQIVATRRIAHAVMGALPAVAWLSFSLIYYGSAVPNTALSKVATGLPLSVRFDQAIDYLRWTLDNDPVTLVIIVAGTLCAMGHRQLRPFAVALACWPLYLMYVGADYTGGRFLSAATLMGAVFIAHAATPHVSLGVLLCLLLLPDGLRHTLWSPPDFQNRVIDQSGIADERGFYYEQLGLVPVLQEKSWQAHPWFRQGAMVSSHPGVYTLCAIGMTGYAAGPRVYIIDPLALTDPFLARLPSRENVRVGHYERAFPPGYLSSRVHHRNDLQHPALRALYNDVLLVTQSTDLWSIERLQAIWRLNVGHHRTAVNAAHDRVAIGLPGHARVTNSKLSCFGIPYGWDGIYKLEGDPVHAINTSRAPINGSQLPERTERAD